jgi:hypothetical protein
MELQGPNPDVALADFYDLLVRGLRAAIGGHRGGVEANFGDFAQEALIKITGNVDSFRGESRFTTWAQKIPSTSSSPSSSACAGATCPIMISGAELAIVGRLWCSANQYRS